MTPEALFTAALQLEAGWKVTQCRFEGEPRRLLLKLVDFYQMYPGMYVPRTLEIVSAQTDATAKALAQEILALTKMNWNNTQFDASFPITVKAARQVGSILRYLGKGDPIQERYAFYM